MKEPARAMNTCFNYNRVLCLSILIACGSFKTIPNSLRQLPAKNLMIPEAPYCWAQPIAKTSGIYFFLKD
jgi:hypothetical protein